MNANRCVTGAKTRLYSKNGVLRRCVKQVSNTLHIHTSAHVVFIIIFVSYQFVFLSTRKLHRKCTGASA